MKEKTKIAPSVDAYIAQAPAPVQARLKKLRQTIRALAPEAEESISYGMPAYKLHGRPLVYFAAFERHIGFYPIPSGIRQFEPLAHRQLLGVSKTCRRRLAVFHRLAQFAFFGGGE